MWMGIITNTCWSHITPSSASLARGVKDVMARDMMCVRTGGWALAVSVNLLQRFVAPEPISPAPQSCVSRAE